MTTHSHPELGPVDVYPVGVLASLIGIRRALFKHHRHPAGQPWRIRARVARNNARRIVHTVVQHARDRDWNGLRNSLNGYLAEPLTFPAHMTRCGHAWTKRRALASLDRHHRATNGATR